MCHNDADELTNSVNPDQTAHGGAVESGSALLAWACPCTRYMLYYFIVNIWTFQQFHTFTEIKSSFHLLQLEADSHTIFKSHLFLLAVTKVQEEDCIVATKTSAYMPYLTL